MGGGALDVYRVCERMAAIDLGLATSELATFLGSDPIRVGGTEEQKREYMTRIAKEGVLFAYGATEPEAGSDLGALKTTAEPVSDNGTVAGYRISGAKQWISNGGVADIYTILAIAPGGPSWFVVDAGAEGFTHGDHEDKHGIRLSNTAALFLDDVVRRRRPADRRRRGPGPRAGPAGVRLHAADGRRVRARRRLGGARPRDRLLAQAHPGRRPAVREAGLHAQADRPARGRARGRARRRSRRPPSASTRARASLNIEGAIAKYLATEAGDAAADAAIQAHGGYGYTHDYMVEKIKRDVRITRIYEGTSEIMEMTDRARALAGAPQERRRLLPRAGP